MSEYQTGAPSGGSTTQTAKDEASSMAHSAAESGRNLAGQARSEAGEITREAGRQAKSLLDQGRGEVTENLNAQQRRLAEGVRTFSSQLHQMADSAEEPGLATDVTRQVASGVDSVAGWLEDRQPADLLDEVKTFARTRPGTFLAIAFGAGLLAGRLMRGAKDAASDDVSQGSGSHRLPGAASTTAPQRTSAYGADAGVSSYGTGAATGSTGSPYEGGSTTTYGTGAAYGATTSTGTGAAYAAGTGGAATGSGWNDDAPTSGTAGGTPTYGVEGDDQPTQAYSTDALGTTTGYTEGESSTGEGEQR